MQFPDGQAWIIDGGLAWGIGLSDDVVFVPQGFVHARTGVPSVLWSMASYTRAAVVHDWLYWAQPCSRSQADNLLVIAMKEGGVPWLQRHLVYRAVRIQGEAIWRRNAEERRLGMPRFNPYGYVPDGLNWPQLRARMFREGIRDVRYVAPNDYCRHGNSQDVPGPGLRAGGEVVRSFARPDGGQAIVAAAGRGRRQGPGRPAATDAGLRTGRHGESTASTAAAEVGRVAARPSARPASAVGRAHAL